MAKGKSLKIFLMDGVASGRWICELSNWNGKAYKIPRTEYSKCLTREELRKPSIYFLFGYSENNKPRIYIGETEDAIQRLGEHIKDDKKEFWNEAIIFISKDDQLNKAHIKYLESRFYDIAKEVDRYKVENTNQPKKSTISEAEVCEMEEFIENVRLIVPTLGYKAFEPLVPKSTCEPTTDETESFYFIENKNGINATGMASPEGFIVLKGSKIFNEASKSLSKGILKLREQCISEEIIQEIDGRYTLTKDVLLSSSSTASSFVLGYSSSGPQTWKNKQGKTLKEVNEEIK